MYSPPNQQYDYKGSNISSKLYGGGPAPLFAMDQFFYPSGSPTKQSPLPYYTPGPQQQTQNPTQSVASFTASSQSSEAGMDASSASGSFHAYSGSPSVPTKFGSFGINNSFPPPEDFSNTLHQSGAVELPESRDVTPIANTDEVYIPTPRKEERPINIENSTTRASSPISNTAFVKQDPSQSLYPPPGFEAMLPPQQQVGAGSNLPYAWDSTPSVKYHSETQSTQFIRRGHPISEMGKLTLAVTEYQIKMSPQKLTMLASKCHADESGFVLVFEVPKMNALALSYFRKENLAVCDVVFTNSEKMVKSSPPQFNGHFICMLRRSKAGSNQSLRSVVVDDILCCRPWFETKLIEFNTINPIISDVSIICNGRKKLCVGQSAEVIFQANACNSSPLYFHPEAKGLRFYPQMVVFPAMSLRSFPVKITPLEGCNLRPNIRLNLCDLNENEEKIGLSLPFIVLPKVKPLRTIRDHEVIYVDDDKTCMRVLDELMIISNGFVFLDSEWKPMSAKHQNKIALIQICAAKKCYLIHIHKFRDRIPPLLFHFLASPKIIKIGLAISYDAKKFHDDYMHPLKPILDLRDFTWFQDRDKRSLNFLVQNVLKEPNRGKKCTLSNWENDLDELQIEYAALDAILMSEIFETLFGTDSKVQAHAIQMFRKRNPSLVTQNMVQPRPLVQVKPKENQTEEAPTGTIDLVDANGNPQYKISKKHAKRLLMLRQATQLSENVLQLLH